MKIGCSTWCLGKMNLEEKLRLIRKAGFELVEAGPGDFPFHGDREWMRGLLLKNALKLHSYHSRDSLDREDAEKRRTAILNLREEVKLTSSLGGRIVVVHPVGAEDEEVAKALTREALDEVLPLAQEEGILLCLENLPAGLRLEGIYSVLCEYESPSLRFVLDVGHVFKAYGDGNRVLHEWIYRLKDYLVHLHAEDTGPDGEGHLSPGDGTTDWKQLLTDLSNIHFSGC
ncbi:MAG: hypothetical protein DRP95_04365, partial [Candidatus Latescibacterota bacterium]